jgi:ANTAR domain
MATTGCSRDRAFVLLRQQSQAQNRKLRDIAADIVVGLPPMPLGTCWTGSGRSPRLGPPGMGTTALLFLFSVVAVRDEWQSKWGPRVLAVHSSLEQAVEYTITVASIHPPSRVYMHSGNSTPEILAEFT